MDGWFEALLEAAPFGIVLVNTDGRITVVNTRAEQLFGYNRLELIDQEMGLLLADRLRATHRQHLEQYFAAPRVRAMGIGLELSGRHKDGREFPIEVGLGLIETHQQAIAFITDITGRREMEAALEQERQVRRMRSFDSLSADPPAAVTARAYGLVPLRHSVPDVFDNLVDQYGQLLDLALERRAFKVEHDLSPQLQETADHLGFLKAGPRDVVEIHTSALRQRVAESPTEKTRAYLEEGGVIVLELMGYLVSYYRKT